MSHETVHFLLAQFTSSVHERADYVITGAPLSGVMEVALTELEIVVAFQENNS